MVVLGGKMNDGARTKETDSFVVVALIVTEATGSMAIGSGTMVDSLVEAGELFLRNPYLVVTCLLVRAVGGNKYLTPSFHSPTVRHGGYYVGYLEGVWRVPTYLGT